MMPEQDPGVLPDPFTMADFIRVCDYLTAKEGSRIYLPSPYPPGTPTIPALVTEKGWVNIQHASDYDPDKVPLHLRCLGLRRP